MLLSTDLSRSTWLTKEEGCVLQVEYCLTGEGWDEDASAISLRGLDAAVYYRFCPTLCPPRPPCSVLFRKPLLSGMLTINCSHNNEWQHARDCGDCRMRGFCLCKQVKGGPELWACHGALPHHGLAPPLGQPIPCGRVLLCQRRNTDTR